MLNRPYAAVVRGEDVLFTETHNHSLRIADRHGNVSVANRPSLHCVCAGAGFIPPPYSDWDSDWLASAGPIRHAARSRLPQGLRETLEYRQSTLIFPLSTVRVPCNSLRHARRSAR